MWRVLVIDDDPNVHLLIRKILGSSGIDVIEASDGAEGLSQSLQARPDLILCDVMMPVMDGMEFLREWSTSNEISHIPVVMVTSLSEKDRIIAAIKLGACDYIVKPFDPLGLRTKISKLLKEAAARRGPPRSTARGLRKKRPLVLVASENDNVRRLAVEALHEHYDVIEAEDGADCLHRAMKQPPDLLLLSHTIPVIESRKVVAKIKGSAETDGARIGLLVPGGQVETLDHAFQVLLNGTIELPADSDALHADGDALHAAADRLLERDKYYFYDCDDVLVLNVNAGGLAAAAADRGTFDQRLRTELREMFNDNRPRMEVDLCAIAPEDTDCVALLEDLVEQANAHKVNVAFKVSSNADADALVALGVPRKQISRESDAWTTA